MLQVRSTLVELRPRFFPNVGGIKGDFLNLGSFSWALTNRKSGHNHTGPSVQSPSTFDSQSQVGVTAVSTCWHPRAPSTILAPVWSEKVCMVVHSQAQTQERNVNYMFDWMHLSSPAAFTKIFFSVHHHLQLLPVSVPYLSIGQVSLVQVWVQASGELRRWTNCASAARPSVNMS